MSADSGKKSPGVFGRLIAKATANLHYCMKGVWNDPRNTRRTRLIKTLNLSVSSFFDSRLQLQSMSLTYSTVLSIVPAFALILAIGRGFGLQDILQKDIYAFFPSQVQAISAGFRFVDSYLATASQGIFVGIGLIMLLWTIISLLSQIEDAFNTIWCVKKGRTIYQKFTDYISICLLIPVLMVCSSGVTFFMTDVIRDQLGLHFLTPVLNFSLEFAPLVLSWLAFSLSYYLIPNTKVKLRYAMIAGAFSAIGFQILQLIFMNGQLYVSKYNAIYGSFAFLPLLLIWLQFSWLLLLSGCVVCYSMQNVFTYKIIGDISTLSTTAWHNLSVIVMAVIARRFLDRRPPVTRDELAREYYLPVKIVDVIVTRLCKVGLVNIVDLDNDTTGLAPAVSMEDFTLAEFYREIDGKELIGTDTVIGDLYPDLLEQTDSGWNRAYATFGDILIRDINLPSPEHIREKLDEMLVKKGERLRDSDKSAASSPAS